VPYPATVVLILTLAAVPVLGTEKAPPITKATVHVVGNRAMLNTICNSKTYIFACTAFRDVFSCSCEQVLQHWHLDVSVQVTPLIYLWKPEYLGHENDHIGDIRGYVLRYVQQLDERNFDSMDECTVAAQHETDGFHHLMNTFVEDSQAKRHPFYQRRLAAAPAQ
jgi:hypothetical protein